MKAVLSLLLPCLLADVWLVPGLAPGPWSPEAQAEPETLQPPTAQNETTKGVQPAEGRDETWLTASGQQLSEESSNLGFSLLRKISMRHEGNVVFSPLGLSSAMAVLTLGAKGQMKAQLESGLRPQAQNQTWPWLLPALFRQLREHLSGNCELGLTQSSWAFIHEDFDVKETFLNLSKRYFDTECVTMNFRNASQAKGLMNRYINKKTQGKIPKLFDEVNPDTKLILVDYILLQGNATMLVVLMEKMGDHFALEDYLTTDLVDTWLRNMKTRNMEVFFPKFKLDQKYEMHELLKQMGIRRLFSPWADLGELSVTARNLKVSKVLQRAVIEVNEKGTEAMAGTLSEIIAYSMPSIIKVDRPFHFMIYEENSRMLLFLGRVVNPTVL
ncbi:serpin family A member 10 [Rhinolophus ferrumequinum]|uniref:Serpin family A member 10 n=1 Tax=Rhinolophus ferrumequinum TaxID=59479 RepID=A0A7J7XRM2_RHIFE|nr:serpin family A member 10 [Rhinolophus ferrumequinum]